MRSLLTKLDSAYETFTLLASVFELPKDSLYDFQSKSLTCFAIKQRQP